MSIYGYCRISTPAQKIERQVENILRVAPNAIIIKEAFTGRSLNRPEWLKLMKKIKSGDILILDEVSRMSRCAEDGIEIYEQLFKSGVEIRFIKQPHINTETYKNAMTNQVPLTGEKVDLILIGLNKYLLELAKSQIKMAFDQSEQEVDFLRTRTKEGLRTARSNGVILGRPQGATSETKKCKQSKELIKKHCRAFGGSLDDGDVIKLCGCSRNSYYAYKRAVKFELEQAF